MTTVVVAHDAGGAEILSSWALRQKDGDLRYVLAGPAVEIFEGKLPRTPMGDFKATDFVLCGSSATDNLEKRMVSWALRSGIPCAVYLDHWKNYQQRFGEFPNEIWVTDRWAANLVLEELVGYPEEEIRIKGNPYLEDTLGEVRALEAARTVDQGTDVYPKGDPLRFEHVLFVHEPGREKEFQRWAGKRFGENQLLRDRPHPSMGEAERTLAEDIAWAGIVVGCDSMAMAVALRAGRKVYSVLPKGEELTIPYPGIERFYG